MHGILLALLLLVASSAAADWTAGTPAQLHDVETSTVQTFDYSGVEVSPALNVSGCNRGVSLVSHVNPGEVELRACTASDTPIHQCTPIQAPFSGLFPKPYAKLRVIEPPPSGTGHYSIKCVALAPQGLTVTTTPEGTVTTEVIESIAYDTVVNLTGSADPCRDIQLAISPALDVDSQTCPTRVQVVGAATFKQSDLPNVPAKFLTLRGKVDGVRACVLIAGTDGGQPGGGLDSEGYPALDGTQLDPSCLHIDWQAASLTFDPVGQSEVVIGISEGAGYFLGEDASDQPLGEVGAIQTGHRTIQTNSALDSGWVSGVVQSMGATKPAESDTAFIGVMTHGFRFGDGSKLSQRLASVVTDDDNIGWMIQGAYGNELPRTDASGWGVALQAYGNASSVIYGSTFRDGDVGISLGDGLHGGVPQYHGACQGALLGGDCVDEVKRPLRALTFDGAYIVGNTDGSILDWHGAQDVVFDRAHVEMPASSNVHAILVGAGRCTAENNETCGSDGDCVSGSCVPPTIRHFNGSGLVLNLRRWPTEAGTDDVAAFYLGVGADGTEGGEHVIKAHGCMSGTDDASGNQRIFFADPAAEINVDVTDLDFDPDDTDFADYSWQYHSKAWHSLFKSEAGTSEDANDDTYAHWQVASSSTTVAIGSGANVRAILSPPDSSRDWFLARTSVRLDGATALPDGCCAVWQRCVAGASAASDANCDDAGVPVCWGTDAAHDALDAAGEWVAGGPSFSAGADPRIAKGESIALRFEDDSGSVNGCDDGSTTDQTEVHVGGTWIPYPRSE